MSQIVQLAQNGIAPSLSAAVEAMQDGLWTVIDEAAAKGMPIGLIVGQLEVIKAAMIEAHFLKNRGE